MWANYYATELYLQQFACTATCPSDNIRAHKISQHPQSVSATYSRHNVYKYVRVARFQLSARVQHTQNHFLPMIFASESFRVLAVCMCVLVGTYRTSLVVAVVVISIASQLSCRWSASVRCVGWIRAVRLCSRVLEVFNISQLVWTVVLITEATKTHKHYPPLISENNRNQRTEVWLYLFLC